MILQIANEESHKVRLQMGLEIQSEIITVVSWGVHVTGGVFSNFFAMLVNAAVIK